MSFKVGMSYKYLIYHKISQSHFGIHGKTMKSLIIFGFFGLVFGKPDIGLELRKPLQTSYGVPVESVTGLPPNYLPPSPTFHTPLVSTAVPFYSGPTVTPTLSPIIYDQSVISQIPSHHQIYQQQFYSQPSPSVYHHPAEVQKHVYFYEAPEEPEDIHPHVAPTAPPSKKNVKIIFIKAPTYKVQPYVPPVAYSQQEKTLVYVLVKKPEEQQQIVVEPPPPTPPTKPEVYFIKYKNQAEAEEKVQNTLNTHAESGANIITNQVETGSIGNLPLDGLSIVTTPSPIITNYVSSSLPGGFVNPSISINTNGINGGQFVSSTESPFIASTYGPIISSTESPVISSTYYPSIDANKIVDSYGVPHQTYGIPNKK
ncbi:uncharacterized protein [Onthophagus taurus]|uniref:uncharacterized protein n=1 Tax=Onthophagus taurus TaxID=166361 RepID=UPI0039BDCC22